MKEKTIFEIVDTIDTSQVFTELSHPHSGGICVFVGAVREFTDNEAVLGLEFETYKSMALLEMEKIADEAIEKMEFKQSNHPPRGRREERSKSPWWWSVRHLRIATPVLKLVGF